MNFLKINQFGQLNKIGSKKHDNEKPLQKHEAIFFKAE